jgi:hypothetical protein
MARRFIRWTEQEKALISERARKLMQDGVRSPLAALKKAQAVLPRQRRRTLLYMGQVPWFKPEGNARPSTASAARAAPTSSRTAEMGSASSLSETVVYFFTKLLREAREQGLQSISAPTTRVAGRSRSAGRRRG